MAQEIWKQRKNLWCGLPWTFTIYTLYEEKFVIDTGFLNKKQEEVRLYRILDISLNRSFIQRIFGLGTIVCSSTDKSLKTFEIKNIKNSEEIKNQLSDLIEKERRENRVSSREYMGVEDDDEFDDIL